MQIIQNNPYRTVGLLVGATAREQERQIRKLIQFIEAEQEPQEDFSFPTLGDLHRTLNKVTDAASKLNLDSDKMNAALFWFYDGKTALQTDEEGFNAIKEDDLDQAIKIWTKLTSNGEVSQRNASAYCNLGTLYLSGILDGTNTHEALLEQGISLKLKFLESDFIKDFKALATDETFKTTKKELQLMFLNQVQTEIEKNGAVPSNKFLDILNNHEFTAKEDFLKSFVQKPIEQIENKIETAKSKRKASKSNAAKAGQVLFASTANDLTQLRSIVGASDLKYTSIADKVANEILQCSIDYFNDSQEKDNNTDYAITSMKLAKQAETLAVGKPTKDRVKDSIETLEEMKDREISQAIDLLKSIKDAYENAYNEIVKTAKRQLGIYDEEEYIEIGGQRMRMPRIQPIHNPFETRTINYTAVEDAAKQSVNWEKVVELIQQVIPQKNIDKIKNTSNSTKINEYKSLVNFLIGKLSYSNKNMVAYLNYWETPRTISSSSTSTSTSRTTSSSNSSGGGCYIATMAYGSYEHPQVMILRQFRDEVLDKSSFGKWFIKTYYQYSPKLVEKLKNKKTINTIIRKVLHQFIKLIK